MSELFLNFHENYPGLFNPRELFIFGDSGQAVTVQNGNSFNQAATLNSDGFAIIEIPASEGMSGTGINNLGFQITSDDPIQAYFSNRSETTTDLTIVFEKNTLGTEYVLSSFGFASSEGGQFSVQATENQTTVDVTLPDGQTFSQTINAGETFKFSTGGNNNELSISIPSSFDLTGTLIQTTAPVAVFSGHGCTNIGLGFCDHIVEQMPPIDVLSTSYIVGEAFSDNGDGNNLVRVVAAKDNTQVTVDGLVVETLNAGQFYEFTLSTDAAEITTSEPALVAQYLQGGTTAGEGDPAMMFVPGQDTWLKKYKLATPADSAAFRDNLVNVVIPTTALASLTLNDTAVDTSGFVPVGNSGLSVGNLEINPGLFTMEASEAFQVSLFGYDVDDSYLTFGASSFAVGISNRNPVLANNNGLTVDEDAVGNITSTQLQVTDADNIAAELTYTVTDLPDNGNLLLDDNTLALNDTFTQADINNNRLIYNHNGSETTTDSFNFTVSDGVTGSIGTSTFDITVNPVDDADLVVDEITLSSTEAIIGESLEVSWTVSNQGTGATSESWSDRIYLSTDENLSNDDISLGEFSQNTPLAANETYSQTESVNLPLDTELSDGNYYILVKTDDLDSQVENSETNNLGTVEVSVSNPPSLSGFEPVLNLADLDGTNGFAIKGIDEGDYSGQSVSNAGDINGDGIDDMIIGADSADPNETDRAGESYVVFGRNSGFDSSLELSALDGSNGFVINSSGIDRANYSGLSVSNAGDVNGDGIDDIIIGVDGAGSNGSASGQSYVVFGRNSGFDTSLELSELDGNNGFVINGIDSFDYSGSSVSSAGDVNGDGIDDIIIGADGADPNGNSEAGESYVIFGRSSSQPEVNPPPSRNVDLVVDVNVSPNQVLAGETLALEWIVQNQGTDSTGFVWFDQVYLSLDNVLSFDDISRTPPRTPDSSIGLFKNIRQLSPGETYRYEDELSIPSNLSVGTYYLLVKTDGTFIEVETNEDNNVGFDSFSVIESPEPPPQTGTIRGTKWDDINGDGLRNSNEPGLSGVRIYLDFNHNGSLDINEPWLPTDESGNYEFSNLLLGAYNVREIIPEGFEQTVPKNSTGLDFHPIPSLSAGQVVDGIDFGNRKPLDSPRPGVIRGIKWNDLDGNGFQSASEPGLPGVTIYLDLNKNGVLDPDEPTAVTNQAGEYEFKDLPSGIIYHVREIIPSGFIQTYPFFPGTISGDSFADEVIQFSNGGQQKLGGTAPSLDTPPEEISIVPVDNTDAVLGNDPGEVDFLVIPKDASITVGFDNEITFDRPGNDIFITEYAAKAEEAEVFVSSDGVNFELLGEAKGGQTTGLDLADIGFTGIVQAVKIVALNEGTGTPGFELANVEVQNGLSPQPDFHPVYVGENGVRDNINFGNFSESEEPPEDDGITPGTDPGEEQQPPESVIPNPPEETTRSKGEPHLTTFDGVGYSFQGAGEFTLVESLNDDFNVQVRYVEIDSRATVASAVATIVDGQRVEIDSEGIEFVEGRPIVTRSTSGGTATVSIDGEVVEIPDNGDRDIGNSKIYRRGEKYTIVYAGENGTIEDGDDQLVVNYLRPGTINIVDVFLGDEKKGQVQGLGGNLNDNPDDDVSLPDGTPLERPLKFSELYGDYREAWRIKNPEESLFDYEEGQGPDTFYNPNFPTAPFSFDDLDPDIQARAIQVAFDAGYEPGTFEFESAAFDFAITNDPGFLEGVETDPEVNEALSVIDDSDQPEELSGQFTGSELQLEFVNTSSESFFIPVVSTVENDVEFQFPNDYLPDNIDIDEFRESLDSIDLPDSIDLDYVKELLDLKIDIDITENAIIYEIVEAPSVDNLIFNDAEFNGVVFTDILDTIPEIENVTIDTSTTTLGVTASDISFTEDTVSINFAGIAFDTGDTVKLDVTFVSSSDNDPQENTNPSPTPESTSTPTPEPTPDPEPIIGLNPEPTPTPDSETITRVDSETDIASESDSSQPTPPELPNATTVQGTAEDDIQLGSEDSEEIRGSSGDDIQFGLE